MEYPSNSYTHRGKMKRVAEENPEAFQNDLGHYYVRLKYASWKIIYGAGLPIHFPTLKAALLFAEVNISIGITRSRVYTPTGTLVKTFAYTEFGVASSDAPKN